MPPGPIAAVKGFSATVAPKRRVSPAIAITPARRVHGRKPWVCMRA
jgi:hypothetical protein